MQQVGLWWLHSATRRVSSTEAHKRQHTSHGYGALRRAPEEQEVATMTHSRERKLGSGSRDRRHVDRQLFVQRSRHS